VQRPGRARFDTERAGSFRAAKWPPLSSWFSKISFRYVLDQLVCCLDFDADPQDPAS
jgi:hypothetical protein